MSNATIAPVRRSVFVEAPPERAFEVFTAGFATWWPKSHSVVEADQEAAYIEPAAGGRWYERGVDGAECDWGRVLVWEPPHRIVFSWQINGSWQYDPDPARASEIEIRFSPDGPQQTLVELEHRHLDRLANGQAMHDGIDQAGGGWSSVLQVYAAAAAGREPGH